MRVNEAIGDLQVQRGLFYEAVAAYQRALALATERQKRAALKTKIGTAYGHPGNEGGLEFLEAAQKELDPDTQRDELAHTLTMLGRYHHYRAQHKQAIAYLERARELAEPLDNPLTLTYIYAYLAGAYQHLAQYDASMRWARQCITLGERKDYPYATAIGYEFLAESWTLIGEWEEALTCARLDREIGERVGSQDRVAWSQYSRALSLYGQGHLQAARDAARSNLDLAERRGDNRLVILLDGLLAFAEADLGLHAAALASAERAMTRSEKLGQVVLQCWSLYARVYLHLQCQEWENALALVGRGVGLYTPTDNRMSRLYVGLAEIEALRGADRLSEAADRAASYLVLAREAGSLHYEGIALRRQGQIALAQGLLDDAGRAFDAAVGRLEELGSRLELGRALYQRSRLRQAQGQPDQAQADAERACTLLEACGVKID
jgi:tetratricopeptide (TPR) repeat protein